MKNVLSVLTYQFCLEYCQVRILIPTKGNRREVVPFWKVEKFVNVAHSLKKRPLACEHASLAVDTVVLPFAHLTNLSASEGAENDALLC